MGVWRLLRYGGEGVGSCEGLCRGEGGGLVGSEYEAWASTLPAHFGLGCNFQTYFQ